jgi:hypothetical protein
MSDGMSNGGSPGDASARFAELVAALAGRDGVSVGSGRRRFGSGALQVDGHIFAMLNDDRLVLKLPVSRVADLLAKGIGVGFDAGKGRPMREWIALDLGVASWLALADEALAFVRGH